MYNSYYSIIIKGFIYSRNSWYPYFFCINYMFDESIIRSNYISINNYNSITYLTINSLFDEIDTFSNKIDRSIYIFLIKMISIRFNHFLKNILVMATQIFHFSFKFCFIKIILTLILLYEFYFLILIHMYIT